MSKEVEGAPEIDADSHGQAAEAAGTSMRSPSKRSIRGTARGAGATIFMSPCGLQVTTPGFQGAIGGRHIDQRGRAMSEARRNRRNICALRRSR